MSPTSIPPTMAPQTSRPGLISKTVVFAEGADEERLVVALARQFKPSAKVFAATSKPTVADNEEAAADERSFDIQVVNAKGRGNLNQLTGLPFVPGFNQIQRLVILWDAEDSHETSFAEIQRELQNAGLPVPDRPWESISVEQLEVIVGILRVDDEASGCLESIVIAAIRSEDFASATVNCVDSYLNCLADKDTLNRAHMDKRWVNAWLASRKPASLRLGAAFEQGGLIPLSHRLFEPILNALNLSSESNSGFVDKTAT